MHIAILGGGITGLTAAFHLSRRFPTANLTLFEKSNVLGGWVRSERVCVSAQSKILLEAGPRTLRPGAKGLMELINLLDLTPRLLTTSKRSPAAKNRYLHLPTKAGLVALPSSLFGVLTSPLRGLLMSSVLGEPFRPSNRHNESSSDDHEVGWSSQDESVHSFLNRRFGEEFARVFGSGLVHGIYAADSKEVSVRSAFGAAWEAEERGGGSVVRGILRGILGGGQKRDDGGEYELGTVPEKLKGVSVFSFTDGIGAITRGLEEALRARERVQLKTGVGVRSLHFDRPTMAFEVKTTANEILNPTHIVSALPLPILSSVLPPTHQLPHLTTNSSSNVTVINLAFPFNSAHPIHPEGFGYLIPRPISGYSTDKNEGILGCVFDSCAVVDQDSGPPLTKLTIMLGGPYPHRPVVVSSILREIQHHLALPSPLPEPVFQRVHEHKHCIPVPGVGHLGRMEEMRNVLRGVAWGSGRMEVVGAGVGGVSVADCVESARAAGVKWA